MACLAITCSSYGQHAISIGLQSGLNISSAHNTISSKEHRKAGNGLSLGGYAGIEFGKHLGLTVSPSYDQYNWSHPNFIFESGNGGIRQRIQYINLPVVLFYSFGNSIQFHVGAGLFGGLLIDHKSTVKTTDTTAGAQTIEQLGGEYKNINAGVVLAAGIRVPVSKYINLLLDVRNSTGLTNIRNDMGLKLNTVSILAGLSFKIR